MPKKHTGPERPRDQNELAKRIVDIATGIELDVPQPTPDPAAVKRGNARAAATTPAQRTAIAKKAAAKRWEQKHR